MAQSIRKLENDNQRLKRAMAKVREEGKAAVEAGIRTGAGMASAFGVAYMENRYPDKSKVFGVDVSLLVGVAGTAAGAFGLVGDEQTNRIVEAIGNGALFAFTAKKGAEMGAEAAQAA